MPVPLRDMAGDAPRLFLEGALLMGREGGRVVAGDMPRAGLSCAMGLIGLVLLKGLHLFHDSLLMTHLLGLLRKCVGILIQSVCTLNAGVTQLHSIDLHCLNSMSSNFCNFAKVYSLVAIVLSMQSQVHWFASQPTEMPFCILLCSHKAEEGTMHTLHLSVSSRMLCTCPY